MKQSYKNPEWEYEWRIHQKELWSLRDERNKLVKEIARLKKAGLDASVVIAKKIEIDKEVENAEKKMENLLTNKKKSRP